MIKNIYIHLWDMESCVCLTDYNNIQKRAIKDFCQLFCMATQALQNQQPMKIHSKKLAFLLLRVG
jgi:hypothetical protein